LTAGNTGYNITDVAKTTAISSQGMIWYGQMQHRAIKRRNIVMVEKIFKLSRGNEKAVERVVFDENVHYLHMVFNKGEGLPEHMSNSNVYMTVIRGRLSIGLDDQDIHEYEAGTLLKIPFQTKMNVKNLNDDTLELIVVKAPAPKD